MKGESNLRRLVGLTLVLTVVEGGWALFCASTDLNLGLFYLGLVAATGVFFVPGLADNVRRS